MINTYQEQIRLMEVEQHQFPSDAGRFIQLIQFILTHRTARTSGLYKITVNSLGHVTGATAVAKSDITALGIPAQDTVYTHPTSAGNKHIPTGGSTNQILRWSSSGTATWSNENTGSSYTHPTDGNLHVPKTLTTNGGKVLKAGSTAGSISWGTLGPTDVGAAPASHTHSHLPLAGGTIDRSVKKLKIILLILLNKLEILYYLQALLMVRLMGNGDIWITYE